jgi:hypothetical protein
VFTGGGDVPAIGAANDEILGRLGLSRQEIAAAAGEAA